MQDISPASHFGYRLQIVQIRSSIFFYKPQVQRRLGYCPQFDALIGQMTVKETLFMYARLRGVWERDIPDLVDSLILQMYLEKYADTQSSRLRSVTGAAFWKKS